MSVSSDVQLTCDQQVHTLLSCAKFGGNFARKLAEAALSADPTNRALVFRTWPMLVENYGPGSAFYSEELG